MLLNLLFRLFCICALSALPVAMAFGQLTAPVYNGKAPTLYRNANGVNDTIFVFNDGQLGSLRLVFEEVEDEEEEDEDEEDEKLYIFKWYKFDYDKNVLKFEDQPFFTQIAAEKTEHSDLAQGGYMVTVSTADEQELIQTYVAWIYLNPGFDFELLKNEENEVIPTWTYRTCEHTDFCQNTFALQDTFLYYYFVPDVSVKQELINNITFTVYIGDEQIDAIFEGATDPRTGQYISLCFRRFNPPHIDTEYQFVANDRFGVSRSDNIMYRTIIPYATINEPELPEEEKTSAPVPVKFTSEPNTFSPQNDVYTWRFGFNGDSAVIASSSDLTVSDTAYVYFRPNRNPYQITLKVTSVWECTYVAEAVTVQVDDPMLDTAANVFTPDGANPYFKPYAVSLRQFEIIIYTRTGIEIYRYRGDDLRDWQGWDGTNLNSGRIAPTGVYFFTIRALGWDSPSTRNPLPGPYNGFFHLFR